MNWAGRPAWWVALAMACAPVEVVQIQPEGCPPTRPHGTAGAAFAEGMRCTYDATCPACPDTDGEISTTTCSLVGGDWTCSEPVCEPCESEDTEVVDTDTDTDIYPSRPCDNPTPRIVLGTGERQFEDLDDGDPLEMVAGPQGGHHVLAAVRFLHLLDAPISLDLEMSVRGTPVAFGRYVLQAHTVDTCTAERTDLYGYVFGHAPEGTTIAQSLDGQVATFTVTATQGELTVRDEVAVALQLP